MPVYDDDEKMAGTHKVVHIIVFSTIAILVLGSIAIPIFATIGNQTVTVTNHGANATDVYSEYGALLDSMDANTTEIIWNGYGLFLKGELSGEEVIQKVLDIEDYVNGYPVAVILPSNTYENVIVEHTTSYTVTISGVGTVIQEDGSRNISRNDRIYIQDPDGEIIFSKNGIYCANPEDVIGIGYNEDGFILSEGTDATTIRRN